MEGYNTQVYNLKQDILNLINAKQLPISTIYFIIKDLYRDAEQALQETMKSEIREQTENESDHLKQG